MASTVRLPVFGAVLIGGASRRMGTDKALLEVDGVAMAERVAASMERAGAERVITVGGAGRGLSRPHVADRFPGDGPLGGIITALGEFPTGSVLVAACDLPWVTPEVFAALIGGIGDADAAVANSGRPEPLCALWQSARCLGPLERTFYTGERAVHRALNSLTVASIGVDGGPLRNVNTPADLNRADLNGADLNGDGEPDSPDE